MLEPGVALTTQTQQRIQEELWLHRGPNPVAGEELKERERVTPRSSGSRRRYPGLLRDAVTRTQRASAPT